MAFALNTGGMIDETVFGAFDLSTIKPAASSLKMQSDAGNLIKIANVLAPVDKPSSGKISLSRIANVYSSLAKGSIPVGNQAPNVTGCSIFAEISFIGSNTDAANRELLMPMQSRIELRLPYSVDVNNTVIKKLLLANVALLCAPAGGLRTTDIMRGVLFQAP